MKSSAVDDDKATYKSRVIYVDLNNFNNTHFTVLTATSIILFSSDL